MDFKSVCIRSLSGIVYIAVIVFAILGGNVTVSLLALLFGLLALYEVERLTSIKTGGSLDITSLAIDMTTIGCLLLTPVFNWLAFFWFGLVIVRFIWQLYSPFPYPLKSVAFSIFGQFYIGLPLLALIFLSILTPNPLQLLAIVGMIWINDTGAFLVGCLIGKHKLFPKHSPKKSWEGFFGGLAFNLIAGFIFGFVCFDSFMSIHDSKLILWMITGVIVTVFSTWGDLFESMIKRNVGVKDSGKLIPGHGGILDRIDSLLAVAPATVFYIILVHFVF